MPRLPLLVAVVNFDHDHLPAVRTPVLVSEPRVYFARQARVATKAIKKTTEGQRTRFEDYYDHAEKDSAVTPAEFAVPMQIRLTAYNGSRIRARYARARMAVDPPPTVLLAPAETHP